MKFRKISIFLRIYRFFYELFFGSRVWVKTNSGGILPATFSKFNAKNHWVTLDKCGTPIQRTNAQIIFNQNGGSNV